MGALLCFDQHNIRYITSTVIGEWARDKLTRYALLTGNGDPYIWDFGSAAKHHRLHAPWLHHDHCRAGLLGLRGAVGGIVLVETVFNYQGLGLALVNAVNTRDVPVIQFIVVLLAVFYVLLNIATDLLVLLVSPRKRQGR